MVSVFSTFFTDLTLNCQFVTFDKDFLDYCKCHICDGFSFFLLYLVLLLSYYEFVSHL